MEKEEMLSLAGPAVLKSNGILSLIRWGKVVNIDLFDVAHRYDEKSKKLSFVFPEKVTKEKADQISSKVSSYYHDLGVESIVLTNEDGGYVMAIAGPSYYANQALAYVNGIMDEFSEIPEEAEEDLGEGKV